MPPFYSRSVAVIVFRERKKERKKERKRRRRRRTDESFYFHSFSKNKILVRNKCIIYNVASFSHH